MTLMTRPSQEFLTIGDVTIEIRRKGSGQPLLLLPAEEMLEPDAPFVEQLSRSYEVCILSPPGFGRSNRPDWISCMDDVAYIYLDVLKKLELRDIPVLGFSLGGWIAAEMATKDDSRFAKLVLVGPYGIKVGGPMEREIADFWILPADKVAALKWFDIEKGRRDFKSMSDEALTIIARNTESFARFCWQPYMYNPKLIHRLHRVSVPTLLVWGANDGIVTTDYGRAYSGLIPGAKFAAIKSAGHLPQIEQPAAFMEVVTNFL